MNGIVARFLHDRHFGFITDLDTGKEWFFHENNCEGPASRGTKVTFELGSFRDRSVAIKVRPVGNASKTEVVANE
jgi:cold shock CspA family protein